MKTYTYSEARQRLARLLDQARREGKVQIRRRDGSTFVLAPVTAPDSPLDVPAIKSRLKRGELVEVVRAERERAGNALVEAASASRPSRKAKRPRSGSAHARKKT